MQIQIKYIYLKNEQNIFKSWKTTYYQPYLSKLDKKSLKKEFFYNLDIKINLNSFLVSIKKPVNPKNNILINMLIEPIHL